MYYLNFFSKKTNVQSLNLPYGFHFQLNGYFPRSIILVVVFSFKLWNGGCIKVSEISVISIDTEIVVFWVKIVQSLQQYTQSQIIAELFFKISKYFFGLKCISSEIWTTSSEIFPKQKFKTIGHQRRLSEAVCPWSRGGAWWCCSSTWRSFSSPLPSPSLSLHPLHCCRGPSPLPGDSSQQPTCTFHLCVQRLNQPETSNYAWWSNTYIHQEIKKRIAVYMYRYQVPLYLQCRDWDCTDEVELIWCPSQNSLGLELVATYSQN